MAITNITLAATPTVLVTGASSGTAITVCFFCNNSTEDATINVYLCATGTGANQGDVGDSTTNLNIILREVTVEAKDTYILDTEKMILDSGATLQAEQADSSGQVVVTVSKLDL
ncbi:hypothetical protein CMI37_30005 [Candidatus Pacearchaeota archaeon]|jgi:hypothetical protein|nr:hypothetical protein [Candidatus Pacearchaeota archaeon]|tara:strand:- start:1125 stop:1466 length:342 start_codon:yes stop_codon:yes gene_type:complete